MNNETLQNIRQDYKSPILTAENLDTNPIQQFQVWLQEAIDANVSEPNAMTIATATSNGQPSARIVLLRGIEEAGFLFYTNYESRKGQELLKNGKAALVFWWKELHRQVRIEGSIERVSSETSTAYFQSRPRGSQIGAWASPQSQVIANRAILENKVETLKEEFKAVEKIPLPNFWGGYRVCPNVIEFWQGQPSRLHDRLRYVLIEDGSWNIERLAP